MDLVLWRHAEAEDAPPGGDDLARALTARGERDAVRMGQWLDGKLPETARVLCSPARRCEQTALALGRKYRLRPELAPDAEPHALLEAAQWPASRLPVLLVGHQPTLGRVIAQVLGIQAGGCAVRKGAAWWLRARERDGQLQVVVVAVMPPDLA
ncbi:SixA phosphatase family protein [Ramlibacter sp. MAHUQ-53]|uniref:SixA phosphatase family protein n=1 Tax=unclassified Ramlibacter TaxID=2617605 RepID=UPI003641AA99